VAPAPSRLPALEGRLPLLALLALRWNVGEDTRSAAQASASWLEEEPTAERGHSGLPVAQDDRGGRRRRTRLRDGAKKIKGRKRHLLVDTQGLVLGVRVHSAKVVDREGIKLLLDPSSSSRLPRLSHLWLEAGSTQEKTRGQIGCRRWWAGRPRSSATHRSRFPRR
jgi:hypothetical protein